MSNPDEEWALLDLEERVARRHGMPRRLPLPVKEAEKVSKEGLSATRVRANIQTFLQHASSAWRLENAALAKSFDGFIGKGAFVERAEQASRRNDVAGVVGALQMVCRLDPEDHGARLNLATAKVQSGNAAEALRDLTAIADTFAGDAEFHHLHGEVLRATGDKEGAIGEMVLALEAKPDFRPAMDALVQLGVLARVYENPVDANSLTYVRADSLPTYFASVWDEQKPDVAALLLALAYHETENRPAVVLLAADRLLAASDATEAQQERAAVAAAGALRSLGRPDEARVRVDKFLVDHPTSAPALVERAALARAAGDQALAKESLDAALAIDPGDALALLAVFWPADHDDLNQMAEAVQKLAAHAEAHPKSAGALRSMARAQVKVHDQEAAAATLARAVAIDPTDEDVRVEHWSTLGLCGRFDEVVADAVALGDMGSRGWRLRWCEAEALRATGKTVEARAAFSAINNDESLLVDVRRRAKRAASEANGPTP
jgi:tetratricopeptide (TPR) repeat protein